ncbi:Fur family transcriptional regulator [Pseudobacteriovorax antillogorgiicola]|uniref:Fe2+ or Zn2+ uptake regulation protein n=1 Tax=Pseudobacteriovorax antillogorgiicola TaxID=1513793 RepID=A0A1Y6C8Z2_9BACT|nr:transcriptional repressor [Pseudobacteriovorax antillogorgiicola]TCS51776.1 Fe2+ or Zn2+ uptake regulation protein [Pseudobacteriovorax antillogorgiicola]SMF49900.1 Fe2+ or Zn2+ uptake regulation protein [Pseudobacteriovorax antillogorgiicola]
MEASLDCCHSFKEKCAEKLKDQGHRITRTRMTISETLQELNIPFTAKDVHQRLIDQGQTSFDFATVYRTLQTYSDLELIHLVGQSGRYIKCNSEHICHDKLVHIIYRCEECSKVEEHQLDQELVGSFFFMTKQINPSFESKGMLMELSGQCSDCADKA